MNEFEKKLEMSRELLLQDYRYRAESLWKSEQVGETRVQFFIGLVTAVGAGLGFFEKEKLATNEPLRFVLLGALFALLVVGLITLARMIVRNEHTDKCKKGLDTIRQVFRDSDQEGLLLHYYPVDPPRGKNSSSGRDGWWSHYKKAVQPRKFGGLAHTVAAINALVVGALVAVAIAPTKGLGTSPFQTVGDLWQSGEYVIVAAVVAFFVQLAYIAWREAATKVKLQRGYPTHAGGIVFRGKGDNVEYLLVGSKKDPLQLVLPKGHIEDGEGHAETALREVREEAGVVAHPLGLVATNLEFEVRGEAVNAKFYLMERLFDGTPKEKRDLQWLPYDVALAALKFPESRFALEQAEVRRLALSRQASQTVLQTKLQPATHDVPEEHTMT